MQINGQDLICRAVLEPFSNGFALFCLQTIQQDTQQLMAVLLLKALQTRSLL